MSAVVPGVASLLDLREARSRSVSCRERNEKRHAWKNGENSVE
jgi:hypothetical protein